MPSMQEALLHPLVVHVSNPSTSEREKFKVILVKLASLRPTWATEDPFKGVFSREGRPCPQKPQTAVMTGTNPILVHPLRIQGSHLHRPWGKTEAAETARAGPEVRS